jgi:signal transduction histidine kinase
MLDEIVALMSAQAEARSIMLKADVAPGLPQINADQEGMEQVLMNLISNAMKYSPDTGVVSVSVRHSGSVIELKVSDSGIGIEEADLPRIFDEFYRAQNARTFTTEGTGLGLSIVKSIVETHGGEILLESHSGSGTTVTVRLPVAAPDNVTTI